MCHVACGVLLLIRRLNPVLSSESMEPQPLGHQGVPWHCFNYGAEGSRKWNYCVYGIKVFLFVLGKEFYVALFVTSEKLHADSNAFHDIWDFITHSYINQYL